MIIVSHCVIDCCHTNSRFTITYIEYVLIDDQSLSIDVTCKYPSVVRLTANRMFAYSLPSDRNLSGVNSKSIVMFVKKKAKVPSMNRLMKANGKEVIRDFG